MFYDSECSLSWWMHHVSLRKTSNLLLLSEVIYKCQSSGASWLMVLFSSIMSLLIFYLLDLSITERELLKSPKTVMYLSISPCSSINFCNIFWFSLARCRHIKNCYVSLENWLHYSYRIFPLVIDNFYSSAECYT